MSHHLSPTHSTVYHSHVLDLDSSPDSLLPFPIPTFSSFLLHTSSVIKAFMGSNYLGIPYSFRLCGMILSVPLLCLVAWCTRLGCRRILECKSELERRKGREMERGKKGKEDAVYGCIAWEIYGEKMQRAVKGMILLTQFGFCVGYIVFLSSTLLELEWIPGLTHEYSVMIFLPIILALSMFKDLSYLSLVNAFANFSLLVGCIAVIVTEFGILKDEGVSVKIDFLKESNFANIGVMFGMTVGAFEGIGLVLPLEAEITKYHSRDDFLSMLDFAIFGVAFLLSGFGLLGYLTYGNDVHDVIIASLPTNAMTLNVIRSCLILGIVCTYPLQLFPVTEIVDNMLTSFFAHSYMTHIVSRLFSVFITAFVAMYTPSFHVISAYTGCIGGAALSFIFPSLFSMKLFAPERFSWLWWSNVLMFIFGILGGVAGIVVTTQGLA